MPWCCADFEEHIRKASEDGFGAVYIYNSKLGKRFFLQYRTDGDDESPDSGGVLSIKFCPWCGCDLEPLPKSN